MLQRSASPTPRTLLLAPVPSKRPEGIRRNKDLCALKGGGGGGREGKWEVSEGTDAPG